MLSILTTNHPTQYFPYSLLFPCPHSSVIPPSTSNQLLSLPLSLTEEWGQGNSVGQGDELNVRTIQIDPLQGPQFGQSQKAAQM